MLWDSSFSSVSAGDKDTSDHTMMRMLQVIPTLSSHFLSLSLYSFPFEKAGIPNNLGSIAKLFHTIKLISQAMVQSTYDVLVEVTLQSVQCLKKV